MTISNKFIVKKYLIKFSFFLIFLNLICLHANAYNDSLNNRKNILETGMIAITLFKQRPFFILNPVQSNYMAYSRIINKRYFLKMDYMRYGLYNENNYYNRINEHIAQKGDVLYIGFNHIKINGGIIFNVKKIEIKMSINMGYRWGSGEMIFHSWSQNGLFNSEYGGASSEYNSISIGQETGIYYTFYNRFSMV
ncbi:MAG: hypothetical protein H7321_03080 [Bacteroidia bacterium]|nr:hypothetical protein [Bacteroidia bacterium]